MLGEEERSDEKGSFSSASIPKRIAVVLAGGLVNIVFGLLVYFVLATSTGNYITTTIDTVVPNYSAAEAGLQKNDEIIKINGKRVRFKNDLDEEFQKSNGKDIILTIKRNNETKDIILTPNIEEIKTIGIYLGVQDGDISEEIKSIYKDSPAEKAGIKAGDKILSVNKEKIKQDPYKIVDLISQSESNDIYLEVMRDNEIIEFTVKAEVQKSYKIGVILASSENNFIKNVYYAFWDTIDFSLSIVENLKMMFSGKVSTDQLMGPIGISDMVSKTKGIEEFVFMLALISVSLGVTNLLPFPPLDGGKIVVLIIEAIRKKPIKENVEIAIQMIGFFMLIGISIFVTYKDILRIF